MMLFQGRIWLSLLILLGWLILWGCSAAPQAEENAGLAAGTSTPVSGETESEGGQGAAEQAAAQETMDAGDRILADVLSVQVSGSEGAYQFSVQVSSPDTGCDQYADWWEVVTEQGDLVYRRVLLHSHVSEQPFTRSGGRVALDAETVVWVRAHMNTGGYGGQAFKGSVRAGFEPAELSPDFAAGLADQPPLPEDCAF